MINRIDEKNSTKFVFDFGFILFNFSFCASAISFLEHRKSTFYIASIHILLFFLNIISPQGCDRDDLPTFLFCFRFVLVTDKYLINANFKGFNIFALQLTRTATLRHFFKLPLATFRLLERLNL